MLFVAGTHIVYQLKNLIHLYGQKNIAKNFLNLIFLLLNFFRCLEEKESKKKKSFKDCIFICIIFNKEPNNLTFNPVYSYEKKNLQNKSLDYSLYASAFYYIYDCCWYCIMNNACYAVVSVTCFLCMKNII